MRSYPGAVREFWVYTGLRLALFAASFAVVISAWVLAAGEANFFLAALLAFVLSGIGSYFLLDRQREALAQHVQARAERASARFEERRSREDVD